MNGTEATEFPYTDEQVRVFYRALYGEGPTVETGMELMLRLHKAGITLTFPERRYYVRSIYRRAKSLSRPGETEWRVFDALDGGWHVAGFIGDSAEQFAHEHADRLNGEVSS